MAYSVKALQMDEGKRMKTSRPLPREERLAAKLRENLRRRKAQSREMGESAAQDLSKPPGES